MKKRTVEIGEEVRSILTSERFTYAGTEELAGETVVLLESDGCISRVDIPTWRESFEVIEHERG